MAQVSRPLAVMALLALGSSNAAQAASIPLDQARKIVAAALTSSDTQWRRALSTPWVTLSTTAVPTSDLCQQSISRSVPAQDGQPARNDTQILHFRDITWTGKVDKDRFAITYDEPMGEGALSLRSTESARLSEALGVLRQACLAGHPGNPRTFFPSLNANGPIKSCSPWLEPGTTIRPASGKYAGYGVINLRSTQNMWGRFTVDFGPPGADVPGWRVPPYQTSANPILSFVARFSGDALALTTITLSVDGNELDTFPAISSPSGNGSWLIGKSALGSQAWPGSKLLAAMERGQMLRVVGRDDAGQAGFQLDFPLQGLADTRARIVKSDFSCAGALPLH